MQTDISNHPCFNESARHSHGRIHLPVAPACNIQCNFCNRKFDCVNESRPGVTSAVLEPMQALYYLRKMMGRIRNISVIGIAGPGDPFANPEKTMETLALVKNEFPDKLLCLATNGLNLAPYIDALSELSLGHITVTVNAVDPEIGARIYPWIRYGKKVLRGTEGAGILLENQVSAISALKKKGITVKINSIMIPGVNDSHITEVAREMSKLGADIFNCIPLYKNKGSNFQDIDEPLPEAVAKIRKEAGRYIRQMNHCTRCRADAAGMLGENMDDEIIEALRESSLIVPGRDRKRPYIAVASNEGVLINQHLGEASHLLIYDQGAGGHRLVERRKAPEPGGGIERWRYLSAVLSDCSLLLVNGIGNTPKAVIEETGLKIMVLEGVIEEAIQGIANNENINHLIKRKPTVCGQECSGSAGGCD